VAPDGVRAIEAVAIDKLLEDHGLPRAGFVKMDVAGKDWALLNTPGFLNRIDSIVIEVHNREWMAPLAICGEIPGCQSARIGHVARGRRRHSCGQPEPGGAAGRCRLLRRLVGQRLAGCLRHPPFIACKFHRSAPDFRIDGPNRSFELDAVGSRRGLYVPRIPLGRSHGSRGCGGLGTNCISGTLLARSRRLQLRVQSSAACRPISMLAAVGCIAVLMLSWWLSTLPIEAATITLLQRTTRLPTPAEWLAGLALSVPGVAVMARQIYRLKPL
jgi:hypothetical protein